MHLCSFGIATIVHVIQGLSETPPLHDYEHVKPAGMYKSLGLNILRNGTGLSLRIRSINGTFW